MASNMPVKSFRCGNIQGAIWVNTRDINGQKVSFKTASLRRSWKQEGDVWRDEVINLRKNDVAKTIVVLNKMMEEMLLSDTGAAEGEENE